jgi:3',5'-cyclic AMP phosphodiesterase CpdA
MGIRRRAIGFALLPAIPCIAACAPVAPPRFDLVVYGDCRSHDAVHRRLVDCILRHAPRLVVNTGDLVSTDNPENWARFREIERPLRDRTTYLPVPGNHDLSPARGLAREFKLDRLYYDRRLDDLHLLVLDSNAPYDPDQLRWLEETLSASTARHRVVALHHPPFSDAPDAAGLGAIRAALARHKPCAVFCGHEHTFYTRRVDGVRYVVTGGGGAPLDARAGHGDLARTFHHYLGCAVGREGIRVRVLDERGREDPALAFPICAHP